MAFEAITAVQAAEERAAAMKLQAEQAAAEAVERAERHDAACAVKFFHGMQYAHQFLSISMALNRRQPAPSACAMPANVSAT